MKAFPWSRPANCGRRRYACARALATTLGCAVPAVYGGDSSLPQAALLANTPLEASGGVVTQAALDAAAANQALYLQTSVNGVDSGLISPYRMIGGSLYADAGELRQLGFHVDESLVVTGGLVELSRIPGLVYRLDTLRQVVEITVGAEQLETHRYDAGAESIRPSVSPGVLLNYDTYAQQTRASAGDRYSALYSGLLDLHAFASPGTLIQTGLFRRADPQPLDFQPELRLDTTVFRSDAEQLDTWRAGDLISGANLPWTTPVRLGGLQWQRNFHLQPNLVTFPVPAITGSAAVPSTVDVLVNNIQQLSRPVEPGPFVIDNLPVITGQGEIRVVTRDALGREQVATLPFYAATSLLRPGLTDYSLEVGYLRRNYAVVSNDYDHRLAGITSLRAGVTDWLTLESHAEAAQGLSNAGFGGVFGLGLWGVLSTSLAGSAASGNSGVHWSAGYQWTSAQLALSASTQRSVSRYQTLASSELDASAPREISQMSASTTVAGGGLSLGYVSVQSGDAIPVVGLAVPASSLTPTRTSIGTISYSLALSGRWSVTSSVFREFTGASDIGASLGLAYFFSNRSSVSAATQYRQGQPTAANFQLSQSLPAEGTGPAWRLQGVSGPDQSEAVSAGYRFASATVEAGASDQQSAVTSYAALRGALVDMDYRRWPLLTNNVTDSFALVDTGLPNVDVFYENRPIGRSNGESLLLIPNLTAQVRNQISIDARDVPLDAEVQAVREVAVPLDRSGVLVKFPVARADDAVVILTTADGKPLPLGSALTLNGGESFMVGYDGQAYLKHLAPHNAVIADWGKGGCRANFEYRAEEGKQQQIGPLVCTELQP